VEIVTRIYKMYKPANDAAARNGVPLLASSGNVISPSRIHMIIPAHPHIAEQAPNLNPNTIPDL
jgi:acyl-CoA synthetase (AMP-forming)/AMP-acid ligase II